MVMAVIIIYILTTISLALNVYMMFAINKSRRLISQIELSVVRTMMEDDPKIIGSVLDTQLKLYRSGGFVAEEALRQAKILHGITLEG